MLFATITKVTLQGLRWATLCYDLKKKTIMASLGVKFEKWSVMESKLERRFGEVQNFLVLISRWPTSLGTASTEKGTRSSYHLRASEGNPLFPIMHSTQHVTHL